MCMTTLRVEDFDTSAPETVSLFLFFVSAAQRSAKWILIQKKQLQKILERFETTQFTQLSTVVFSLWNLQTEVHFLSWTYVTKPIKMCLLPKNGPVASKWTCCLKMELLAENRPVAWKWTCCLKMDLLVETGPVAWKWTCCLKLDLLAENGPVAWKWTYWLKMDLLTENGPIV